MHGTFVRGEKECRWNLIFDLGRYRVERCHLEVGSQLVMVFPTVYRQYLCNGVIALLGEGCYSVSNNLVACCSAYPLQVERETSMTQHALLAHLHSSAL